MSLGCPYLFYVLAVLCEKLGLSTEGKSTDWVSEQVLRKNIFIKGERNGIVETST